jgi:hypothetical protein
MTRLLRCGDSVRSLRHFCRVRATRWMRADDPKAGLVRIYKLRCSNCPSAWGEIILVAVIVR